MKWLVKMKVKDYIRSWSDQRIVTNYKSVEIEVLIKDLICEILMVGEDENLINKAFHLVWELLFLYDGYFYEITEFLIDDRLKDKKILETLPMYKTDNLWYYSELLGRGNRDISGGVIEKYEQFRNISILDKKMTKSVVNGFYYLNSENYGKINANHRLSLLLNIADGFVINTFKETRNVKASLDRFFKKTVSIQKLQTGISLLGLEGEKFKNLLMEERHTFDHYVYSENSLATFVSNSNEESSNYITWYFIYVIELVTRINFLKESGVTLDQENMDYALDSINDWIIYENNLQYECITHNYKMKQDLKKIGIDMR